MNLTFTILYSQASHLKLKMAVNHHSPIRMLQTIQVNIVRAAIRAQASMNMIREVTSTHRHTDHYHSTHESIALKMKSCN